MDLIPDPRPKGGGDVGLVVVICFVNRFHFLRLTTALPFVMPPVPISKLIKTCMPSEFLGILHFCEFAEHICLCLCTCNRKKKHMQWRCSGNVSSRILKEEKVGQFLHHLNLYVGLVGCRASLSGDIETLL